MSPGDHYPTTSNLAWLRRRDSAQEVNTQKLWAHVPEFIKRFRGVGGGYKELNYSAKENRRNLQGERQKPTAYNSEYSHINNMISKLIWLEKAGSSKTATVMRKSSLPCSMPAPKGIWDTLRKSMGSPTDLIITLWTSLSQSLQNNRPQLTQFPLRQHGLRCCPSVLPLMRTITPKRGAPPALCTVYFSTTQCHLPWQGGGLQGSLRSEAGRKSGRVRTAEIRCLVLPWLTPFKYGS